MMTRHVLESARAELVSDSDRDSRSAGVVTDHRLCDADLF